MNMMAATNMSMMEVSNAITTPTICDSGSWSIGLGDITLSNIEKNGNVRINDRNVPLSIELFFLFRNSKYPEERIVSSTYSEEFDGYGLL